MEERWLTVAYCAHGLFCGCKNPKKHLEKCLTDAIADAGGDPQGDGGTGGGDASFDIGIDALLAAAAQSGEATEPKDSKQPSEIPAPYHVPSNPGNGTTTGYKTPPRDGGDGEGVPTPWTKNRERAIIRLRRRERYLKHEQWILSRRRDAEKKTAQAKQATTPQAPPAGGKENEDTVIDKYRNLADPSLNVTGHMEKFMQLHIQNIQEIRAKNAKKSLNKLYFSD
uniref:ORF2/2/3 n=1 Tax=Torque teno sus virus 1b TaxID=687387 RepID=V5SNS0_9VIRU|nr:ORF2/2/3 [Torque teno sus virus 1b]